MTLKEVREKLKEFEAREFLENVEVNIDLPHIGFETTKKGVVQLYEFVQRQVDGWEAMEEELPEILKRSKTHFAELRALLDELLKKWSNRSEDQLKSSHRNFYSIDYGVWYRIEEKLNEIRDGKTLLYDTPETKFLLTIHKEFPESLEGANDFLFGEKLSVVDRYERNDFSQQNYFTGVLLAYEFKTAGNSKIGYNRTKSRKQINQFRSDFEELINQSQEDLDKHLKVSSDRLSEHLQETSERINQHIAENDDFTQKQIDGIDEYINQKQSEFERWMKQIETTHTAFVAQSQKNIEHLEITYDKNLSLSKPAKYWKDHANRLRWQGYGWLAVLLTFVGMGIVILAYTLHSIVDGSLNDFFKENISAIRFSIIYVTLISFLAISIRTFSKLVFSAFHLVRDAEEREQLAYFYLSLTKEKEITEQERHLIMQALFSRADTGLLKDDSSPSMPGGAILEKVIKNNK